MNTNDTDEERPLAWTAIVADTPVLAADGTDVGAVDEVIGTVDQDIFHGLVVRVNSEAQHALIPAAHIQLITDRRIDTDLTPEQIRALPAYQAPDSFQLGLTGLLGRLGWVREGDDHT